MKSKKAFTLIELLVVISIIAILALLVTVAAGSFQRKAQLAQSIKNLKDLTTGFINYTGSHDGQLPALGQPQPSFGAAPNGNQHEAWYYSVPKAASALGLDQYTKPEDFYKKSNPLYFPIAKYPAAKTGRPYFAVAINELLYGDASSRQAQSSGDDAVAARIGGMIVPTSTIVFLEVGLPEEETLPGQIPGAYQGNAQGSTSNVVSRYDRQSGTTDEQRESKINLAFGDGHVAAFAAKDIMDGGGKPYFPQLPQNKGEGKVSWTMDPEAKPF